MPTDVHGREILNRPFVFPVESTPLQVLRWKGERVAINPLSGTSQNVAIPGDAKLVELSTTENCFVAFGDNTVVATNSVDATSRLFVAGVQVVVVPVDSEGVPFTHIAAVEADTGGVLQVEGVT